MDSVAPEGDLSPDLLEARSIRYAASLRLARLASGRWAIFWREGPRGEEQLEIFDSLPLDWLEAKAEEQRVGLEHWRLVAEPPITTASAEEMGL